MKIDLTKALVASLKGEDPVAASVSEVDATPEKQDVQVYRVGSCYASACAPRDMPLDEVAASVNLQHPTGVTPWQISSDPTFSRGEPNPCVCNDDASRLHYLLSC